jgi:hypothetical protein
MPKGIFWRNKELQKNRITYVMKALYVLLLIKHYLDKCIREMIWTEYVICMEKTRNEYKVSHGKA